jgi:2,4-dienoyl-CoA reductase-like NADH-dependent reductase (Old Yellow Enzyme family)
MSKYEYLFSPMKLGSLALKNRIICAPHGTQMADPVTFMVTERTKAYYRERAAGGAAVIVLVSCSVDERADYCPANNYALWSDDIIPGLKEIADICHEYDCKFFVQPSHPGPHQSGLVQVDEVPRAPSQVPASEEPSLVPMALTKKEILEIEDMFVRGVERAVEAGVDGIELMASHDKLTSAFFSPLANKRSDEYGGSLENRFRFMGETLDKVRASIGPDFPIGLRLNVMELDPGGLPIEEGIALAKMFEATGKIDWIGCALTTFRTIHYELNPFYANFEPGWAGEFARQIKAEVKLPVHISSKINDPGLADRMIADGKCDYVYIGRSHIADPHFARKAQEGREDDIRPCIYCNQGCVGRSFTRGTTNGIRCTVNPTAGEEIRWGSWHFKRAQRKKILIVGGGPAGLQCALTAAERGHEIVLYDKETELGGQARYIKKIPGHIMPQTFLDYLELQVNKHRINLQLGTEVNFDSIDAILEKEAPAAVVIATGSRPATDGMSGLTTFPIPGHDRPNVYTYLDVLTDEPELGQNVLILDELGDRVSPGIAEILAEQEKQVHAVTRWHVLGPNLMAWFDAPFTYSKLDTLGVRITPFTWAKELTENGATLFNVTSQREFNVDADSVILATTKCSNIETASLFQDKGIPIHIIGDARAPRYMWNATHDGYKIGSEL